jgi:2,5-furandicarboxylate decarboxylase 1
VVQTLSRAADHAAPSAPLSLATYLATIHDRPSELRSVSRPVNPANFDVTAILEHLDRRKEYPAVLFEHPSNLHGQPSDFPLLTNLWGTRARCAEMLGLQPHETGRELGLRYAELMQRRIEPVVVDAGNAPVQAHVYQGQQADMWMLPIVRHFEMDLGAVLTMANVMHAPGSDAYNISFIKTFPEAGQRGGLTIHSKDMGRMLREWQRVGQNVPIIAILGHHPAFWLGSLGLTPYGTNEYSTVGAFLGEPLRLAPSVTWGREFLVPADAEIIIEGELLAGEQTVVDPFGEITRLYQAQELAPVMQVSAITHRAGAIMQDVFSGHAEHFLLGLIPREGSLLNQLNRQSGDVSAVHLPHSGNGRSTCYVSIDKHDEGQPKLVALQAFAHAPMFQMVVVVDDDIDVFNEEDVLWAINTYVDPARDVSLINNAGGSSERAGGNTRIIIDATRPSHIAFPTRLRVPPEALERVRLEDWLDPIGGGA